MNESMSKALEGGEVAGVVQVRWEVVSVTDRLRALYIIPNCISVLAYAMGLTFG